MAQANESFGNRHLWQFISGTGILRPRELIKRELTRNTDKVLNGLLFYKKPRAPQGDLLKDKNLKTQQKEFVLKLTTFLNLEEDQSYEVYFSYLSQDFRGSEKNLQLCLSTERHSHAFMVKIRDFYYSERLYLLQCIRHILTFWSEAENHPYREEYTIFLNILLKDNELIKKLLEQVDLLCDEPLPTWETHGNLMNDRQALVWAHQNLKEQIELLEILLVYWKEFEVSAKDFNRLLDKFKRQGFGRRQTYKHILDESFDRITKRIGSLEVLVLLQAMDMETVERLSYTKCFDDHSLLKDKQTFQSVEKTMQLLGSEQPHGALLLSWAVIRQLYLEGDGANVTRKYGNQALQLCVFDFLSEMLDREPFSGKSITASISHCVIYTVLLAALTAFDETTLTRSNTEMKVLYDITCKLLSREFIAGNVWNKGMEQGVGNMYQTALLNFPLDFSTLVKLSTALASANADSASKVLELWSELPRYTEYLDRNSSQDLRSTRDSLVWQLARDKTPYGAGDFRIPAGVYGQLISTGQKPVSDLDIPIIQWEVTYDGWQLLKSEIQELLHQVARGAGMVLPVQILRVTDIAQFVRAICKSQPTAADGLTDIMVLLYTLIQRFSSFNPPPLELIAACVDCITYVAKLHPKQAWHDMKQTGLLPFLTENIDNMTEVLSGRGLSPGLYGGLLAGFEVPQGEYQLTVAFLEFISELVMPLYNIGQENQLQPVVMYILREIFPGFQKWRYYNSTRKELIGHKCLKIAHKILNFRLSKEKKNSEKPHIQKLCVYSLLFTEAGRALLEIIATGVEPIEMLLAQQSSRTEGSGEDLMQLIQIGFSVMNRLLLLRSHDQLSPVEVALSSQPAGYQNQHIVAVIAEYIYHRTNPLLPKLATLFLRRLAVVLPMSILACLGGQGEAIRDIYLMRLHSATEDLSLKTGILELLSVCVDTQPGLIELFLNVQTTQPSDANKDVLVGRTSCLQTVLDLMLFKKQGSYQCPPDLLCACTNFIQALWVGMRETAMAALRAKVHFWPSLCGPLLKDLSDASEEPMLTFKLKTVSYILKVLAQEIYVTNSTKLDDNLKKILKELAEKGRIKYWSTYITDCIKMADEGSHDMSLDTSTDAAEHPIHKLLLAWKNFLVVLAKINVVELKLDDGLKELIVVDLLEAIHAQFTNSLSELRHKLSQTCSALFFTLVKSWTSSIKVWRQVLDRTLETLTLTMSSGDMIIPSVQIGLLGSVTAILQYLRLEAHKKVDVQKLGPILVSTCEVLLQSTRELPQPQELRRLREAQESTEKSFAHTDHRLKLQTVACCTVEELIHHIRDSEIWLPILQENMILPALLSSADIYLKTQESLHYLQPLFILFLTIAQDKKGAESLAMAGLTQHVCLPVTYCYQNGDVSYPGPKPGQGKAVRPQQPQVTWHSVYCLCLDLYTTMLATMKYSFLEDAFNFVGSHQDRLQQCLEIARFSLSSDMFREVEKTCLFVSHLANFSREWRLHLPESLNKILLSLLYMCQTFVSLLIRPRYLQYILEHQGITGEQHERRHSERLPLPTLQHQASTEDIDSPTVQHVQVQHSMLKVLGECFVALRQFSPDLVQILVDQNMDVGEYEPFLALGFSTPPADQDTPPTFGTMLSCVSVGLRLLTKMDGSKSPQKQDSSTTASGTPVLSQHVSKSLVMFVLENALYLTMSQGMLYLKDPNVQSREKQLLKRELGTEMNSILSGIQRYIRRGGPQSPASSTQISPRSQSPAGATLSRSISQTFLSSQDHAIFRLVQEFSKQVLR
ncbi:nucleoporin NUP188-like isoform X2 [Mercenaria mercenaria]|uniref:nucleoporin NUP188-like isoform X2 n=1 Tax=Mercenaria mercenaria TaxID=6596 RepID=UPI00234E59CD|nr:nucleoporin NUP188-like isoform X2 [Mercenaria mercenaria]